MPRVSTLNKPKLQTEINGGTNFSTIFKIGDKVRVIPYSMEGKVTSLWLKPEGLLIEVRYYTDKECKYEYFYEDELEFSTEKKTGF